MKQISGEQIAPHVGTIHAGLIDTMSSCTRCGMCAATGAGKSGWNDRHTYLPQPWSAKPGTKA